MKIILISILISILTACGGGDTSPTVNPTITQFSSTSTAIIEGSSVDLTIEFENGIGSIDNGVGNVTSGSSVTVTPLTTTTYTLTVRNTAGVSVTTALTVTVDSLIIDVVPIPKTGQITCYNQDGIQIDCIGTGHDGDIQAGTEWPIPRYTDNNDGTISDHLSGLMWLKNTNCMATHYPSFDNVILNGDLADGGVTWQLALDFIKGINNQEFIECSAGYFDWHLPSITELQSLFDFSKYYYELSPHEFFTNVGNSYYWSSTTLISSKTFAGFSSINGYSGSIPKDGSWFGLHVLPVRFINNNILSIPNSGQRDCFDEKGFQIDCTNTGQDGEIRAGINLPLIRFIDNKDGTITDRFTNLMWLKDANCMATHYPEFDIDEYDGQKSQGNVTWEKSLQFIRKINEGIYSECSAGYADWHLPNVNEIKSLRNLNTEYITLSSWLREQGFNNVGTRYATSTTYHVTLLLTHAWEFNTFRGGLGSGTKTGITTSYVWPVRSVN